jgi:hypothetical protein
MVIELLHDFVPLAILLAMLATFYVLRVAALILSQRTAEMRLREHLARMYARAPRG